MKSRFEGKDNPHLRAAIARQELAGGDHSVAAVLIEQGNLTQFEIGEVLVAQGGSDTDVYFLVTGSAAIVVNGTQVAQRVAGKHIGEMSAIEPSLPRSASVVATERTVALRLSSRDFLDIAERFPVIWKRLASEFSRRLYQRNRTIPKPNQSPKLFIISSSESLDIAYALRKCLEPYVFSTVWTEGVFFAGGYVLEALEKQVNESDFAIAVADAYDITTSRGKTNPTVRDNVLFELGLFMGSITRFRAFLVHPRVADLRLPSDLQGLTTVPYSTDTAIDLETRLAPVCKEVRGAIQRLGVRTFTVAS